MLVSHESPISMLKESRYMYNDYDYALVHLFETHPEYYNFFKESLKQGREVLLDNSIFELGTAFDANKFYKYIVELQPSYYVVPDVLENTEATIKSFTEWINRSDIDQIRHIPKIGVVQGTTFSELAECYSFMATNADYIAISFDYSYYQYTGLGTNKLQRQRNGRVKFIKDMVEAGIWDSSKPHHLLGCSLPNEFKEYNEKWANDINIRSLDTSNPIVAGIHNIRYKQGIGLVDKLSIKLCDLIDYKVTDENKNNIIFNADQFKRLNHIICHEL
jgi:hypothetical protein